MTSDQKLLLLTVGSVDTGVGMEAKAGVLDEITTVGDELLLDVAIAYAQVLAIVLIECSWRCYSNRCVR